MTFKADSRQYFQVVTTSQGDAILLPSFGWMKRWYMEHPERAIERCYGSDSCLLALPVMAYMDKPMAVSIHPSQDPDDGEGTISLYNRERGGYWTNMAPLPSHYNDLAVDFDKHFLFYDPAVGQYVESERANMTFKECADLIQQHMDKEGL